MSSSQAANVPTPQVANFQMPDMYRMAGETSSGIQGLQGLFNNQLLPQITSTTQNLINQTQPYGQQGINASVGVSQPAQNLGYGTLNNAGVAQNAGMSLIPYAQNLLMAGYDPQSALYARTAQQIQDQTRAGQAARGISTTPYGAGLEDQAMRDFTINWQNQQLGRMNTAGQGATNMIGAVPGMINQTQQTGQGAANDVIQAALMPYATTGAVGGQNLNWLNQLQSSGTNAAAVPQMGIQDLLAYLGTGNQANSVYNTGNLGVGNFGLNQSKLGWDQNAQVFNQLGKGAGWLMGMA